MSERLQESISALMDGETDELELRRILKHDSGDGTALVRETWRRYHRISQALQPDQSGTAFQHWISPPGSPARWPMKLHPCRNLLRPSGRAGTSL